MFFKILLSASLVSISLVSGYAGQLDNDKTGIFEAAREFGKKLSELNEFCRSIGATYRELIGKIADYENLKQNDIADMSMSKEEKKRADKVQSVELLNAIKDLTKVLVEIRKQFGQSSNKVLKADIADSETTDSDFADDPFESSSENELDLEANGETIDEELSEQSSVGKELKGKKTNKTKKNKNNKKKKRSTRKKKSTAKSNAKQSDIDIISEEVSDETSE